MLGKLLLLFAVIPVVEIYLLIGIGNRVGAGPTIALVLATGLLGAWLAKREGLRVLQRWQGSVARGEVPKEGVISSLLVLVGGVLLVTPGVVTDAMGLALLVPWTRRWVAHAIRHRLEQRFSVQHLMSGGIPFDMAPFGMGDVDPSDARDPSGSVIDVEVVEKPDAPPER